MATITTTMTVISTMEVNQERTQPKEKRGKSHFIYHFYHFSFHAQQATPLSSKHIQPCDGGAYILSVTVLPSWSSK